jgi:hypothetical protein
MNLQLIADKLNKRTTYEWENFMKCYGNSWDALSDEGKQKAVELAEKQGERSAKEIHGLR